MCQGNAEEFEGNVWKLVQRARGMLGNARGTYRYVCKVQGECIQMYVTGCKVPEEYMGMKGNTRVTYGSGYKVPGECRGMEGNARGT